MPWQHLPEIVLGLGLYHSPTDGDDTKALSSRNELKRRGGERDDAKLELLLFR
jgi:hypothetical protein